MIHIEYVISLARATILLVAAMSLTWHGVLLATPHSHADNAVPQEELACSASHPSSQITHLHGSGHSVPPHPCLACLAGTTVADAMGLAEVEEAAVGESIIVVASSDLRSRLHTQLPLLRGPPLTT